MKNTNFPKLSFVLILAFAFAAGVFARSANEVTPLLIGSEIPDATLSDKSGKSIQLSSILEGKNTIIIFYRGGWCPYCTKHMKELVDAESSFLDLGFQIIAISPDSPEKISGVSDKFDINYELYSDSSLEVADAFGITFNLEGKTAERMSSRLLKFSGGLNADRLLIPSVFISTPEKIVSFQYADPNYRFRIPGDLLVEAAKASLRFHEKN